LTASARKDAKLGLVFLDMERTVLKVFAEQHEKRWTFQGDVPRYELEEDDDCFLLIDRDNPMSKTRRSEIPSCGTIIGMLQYQIEMITGHPHEVKEIECRAMGHSADVFRIAKAPTNG
jgi:predicted hydrocarbon binding protein